MNNNSEYNAIYDSNVAFEFFKPFGKVESVKKSEVFFVHGQKASLLSSQTDKIFLLVKGDVTVVTASGSIIHIESGHLFGRFTPYSTRNASVIANIPSELLSLNEKQLLAGIQKKPEFLLMLMDVFVSYLEKERAERKKSDTEIKYPPLLTENKKLQKNNVLDTKMLSYLKQKLGDTALMVVPENRVVIQEGAAAMLMYVILDGYMTTSINNKVVGRSGAGEIVGEVALITQGTRTASVAAETRCLLLAINRQMLFELIKELPTFGISILRILASRLYLHHSTDTHTESSNNWKEEEYSEGVYTEGEDLESDFWEIL